MDYKNKYYWSFQSETSRFGGVMGPSCDYVTEENREAWQRFVEKVSDDSCILSLPRDLFSVV